MIRNLFCLFVLSFVVGSFANSALLLRDCKDCTKGKIAVVNFSEEELSKSASTDTGELSGNYQAIALAVINGFNPKIDSTIVANAAINGSAHIWDGFRYRLFSKNLAEKSAVLDSDLFVITVTENADSYFPLDVVFFALSAIVFSFLFVAGTKRWEMENIFKKKNREVWGHIIATFLTLYFLGTFFHYICCYQFFAAFLYSLIQLALFLVVLVVAFMMAVVTDSVKYPWLASLSSYTVALLGIIASCSWKIFDFTSVLYCAAMIAPLAIVVRIFAGSMIENLDSSVSRRRRQVV